MKKWAQQIEMQRRRYRTRSGNVRTSDSSRSGGMGTSATEFDYMRNIGGQLENPYQYEDEEEEDDLDTLVPSGQPSYIGSTGSNHHPYGSRDFGSSSRNGSQTSLRSRSTTGESGMAGLTPVQSNGRQPPPRFQPGAMQQQPQLALRTRELAQSPDMGPNESYFSPIDGSPSQMSSSTRTSTSSGMYPFPRQQIPQNGYYEEGHGHGTRFTAPAVGRQRDPSGGAPPPNGYPVQNGYPNPRSGPAPQRPGMGMHSAQQMPGQPRNRSASSPDIHNNPRGPVRGPANGEPPVPDMPLPYQQNPHMIPRSQSNSPNLAMMANGMPPPARGMSPQMQRERGYASQQRMAPDPSPTSYSALPRGPYNNGPRAMTPLQERDSTFTPPPPPSFQHQNTAPPALGQQQRPSSQHNPYVDAPTQLKVRVHCSSANQVLTLVVPLNISYMSLKDRIDAKLQRSTQLTLNDKGAKEGQTVVKLKFLDDDDFVSIQSDDDVQTAFETWKEQNESSSGVSAAQGGMGEVDLYCR
jgi:cell division control protein 24